MSLTLYFAPRSVAFASLIALEEAGVDYDTVKLDFSKQQQQSPEYLSINPKGRVPALITDQGILTETPAILTYVASLAEKGSLIPTDPWQAAKAQSVISYLASTVHVAHAHRHRGHRWADGEEALAAMRARVTGNMEACFQHIHDDLLEGPWVLGQTFSVADAHLNTVSRWLEADGVDATQFPRIQDHMTAMAARPSVKRALQKEAGA